MTPTRDHQEIQAWANLQQAVPAEVKRRVYDGEPTILTFLFGSAAAGTPELHPITWPDFFARFDLLNLSMAFDIHSRRFEIVRVESHRKNLEIH